MSKPVKSVLITHVAPTDDNNPYALLGKEWGFHVDFRNFVINEGLTTSEFRKQNLYPLDFSAIVFLNRYSIDNFFRICKELRLEMPADMKYFCLTETTARYLHKYITIRKRKLYVGEKTIEQLCDQMKKHLKDKFLLPSGELSRSALTDYLDANKVYYRQAIVYQTVPAVVDNLDINSYDLICFFSPTSIDSLVKNFGSFSQNETLIGVFGPQTRRYAESFGFRVDIAAPTPGLPSMTMAIDAYLRGDKLEDSQKS
jgi:uroporphyrinogen-III synthase